MTRPPAEPPPPGSRQPQILLQLMWLASPALPVGGFSYSEGLEAAVEARLVHDEISASVWLLDQLQLVVIRSEWAAVMRAHAAFAAHDASDIQTINEWVMHTRETREFRLQAEQMGRSLADWLLQRYPQESRVQALRALRPAPTWPVAFALAGVLAGARVADVLMAHGFSWAENQVQAVIKCIPLGQSAGQRVLQKLSQALPGALRSRLETPVEEAQAYTPGLAIHSARHEQQYSRLFRS